MRMRARMCALHAERKRKSKRKFHFVPLEGMDDQNPVGQGGV